MKLSAALVIGLVVLAAPRASDAQNREKADIPAGSRPPAGMCRIWLDSVPPAQQPAPTDCTSAVRNRPAKGRVIFGDDYVTSKKTDSTRNKPAIIKGFAPSKSSKTKKPPLPISKLPIRLP